MPKYTQTDRQMKVATPLGTDVLMLIGFRGHEAISEPYTFELDLVAEFSEVEKVAFDKLIGKAVTVFLKVPNSMENTDPYRPINGICVRFAEGGEDEEFKHYKMEIVPQLWLLTKKTQSRIFQQKTVPDILKQVLTGLQVEWEIQGTFEARDYCVQYRETDFAFASRLMEEEGIFYFFKHDSGSHTMVLGNTPVSHKPVPIGSPKVKFDVLQGGTRDEDHIYEWNKRQDLVSEKFVLWDSCFELPTQNLEATKDVLASVQAGAVSHKLSLAGGKLEVYDYPGEYAQRFDGVNPSGGEQPSDLQKIFPDKDRTVGIRAQEEAAGAVRIDSSSHFRHIVSGYKFDLERHPGGGGAGHGPSADGTYLLVSIEHEGEDVDFRSAGASATYQNMFVCQPFALPFRPPRRTPRPVMHGSQTAFVVGPAGEEIFTDKYGRVKVQFQWDRDGQKDSNSSCWIRVATTWAGKQWGTIHVPRIGQEVVVDFLEGDPDQPIIMGSVYNAATMPPYKLPDNKTQSGIKSRSTLKGGPQEFNELRFEDKKGSEDIYFHAQKDFHRVVENDDDLEVDHNQKIWVKGLRREQVHDAEEVLIVKDRTHHVMGNEALWVDGEKGRALRITTGHHVTTIDQGDSLFEVKNGKQTTTVAQEDKTSAMTIVLEAQASIELKVGASTIKITPAGIEMSTPMFKAAATGTAELSGAATTVKGQGILTLQGALTKIGP